MDTYIYISINVVLVLVNLGLFVWNKYEQSELRKIALKDNFWFRTIALPMLLKPLQKFSTKQTVELRKIAGSTDAHAHSDFLKKFNTGLYDLLDRCYVINSHSVTLYKDLVTELQKMEDLVAEYCQEKGKSNADIAHQFIRIYTDIISLLMKFHSENKFKN